jgi:hypothetical protein
MGVCALVIPAHPHKRAITPCLMLEKTCLKLPHFLREIEAVQSRKACQRNLEYKRLQVVGPRQSIFTGPFFDPRPVFAATVHDPVDFTGDFRMIDEAATISLEKLIQSLNVSVHRCAPVFLGDGWLHCKTFDRCTQLDHRPGFIDSGGLE